MTIAKDCTTGRGTTLAKSDFAVAVKAAWMSAACGLAIGAGVGQGLAQSDRVGVAKPQPVTVGTMDDESPQVVVAPVIVVAPAVKPSAAVPMAGSTTVYAPYNPATDVRKPLVSDSVVLDRRKAVDDPDAGIVTYVAHEPGEIPDGTLVKARLRETLSTVTTKAGSMFTAEISEPVMRDGQVVVPVGSVMEGRVTMVRGGKRVSGGAAIHLEPRTVTMPDGSQYVLHARVIDTNSWDNTKVDSEGTISRKSNKKGTAAVLGLTAGGGAAAGAMIGGVPGALIGAGVGAGVSTVIWLKQDRQAELPKDLGLVFSLTVPMAVTPEKAVVGPVRSAVGGGE